jgi:hypothetical protein
VTSPAALARGGAVAAGAGAAALRVRRALAAEPPGGGARWQRQNFRGRCVDLLGGPAAAGGALVAAAAVGSAGTSARRTSALVAALAGSAALGCYDDLAGGTHARGLRGHLAALKSGELTTGVVKMAGLATAGLLAAGPRRHLIGRLADAALISGTANLVNLLDLRPGRALKTVALIGTPLALAGGPGSVAAAGAVGTAAVLLPGDLGEQHMLGDCGANALGALVGWAIAARFNAPGRAAALGGVVALTLASEKVSFSAVIEHNPTLAAIDQWGRRPA